MTEPNIISYGDQLPILDETVFVAAGARIVGRVVIGAYSSVWYNVVSRGDADEVRIGSGVNIQDGAVLHEDGGSPLIIDDNVTVAHHATLHGCHVGNGAMIGMGAIVLSGASIGEHSVVGAGALVLGGKEIPPRSLVMGSPAKVVRELTAQDVDNFGKMAKRYRDRVRYFLGEIENPDF